MTDQELLQAIREITKEEITKVIDERVLPIQATLDHEITTVKEELTGVKEEVTRVEEKLTRTMEEKLLPIQAALDHEIIPALKLLAEGHELILERLDDKITAKTEQLEWRVDAIEAVLKQHLREAK